MLRRSERERTWLPEAALGAGLVSATIKIASAGPMLAAFSMRDAIEPQLARALIEMNDYAFLMTWAVDAAMLAAVGACALRTGALPRWLAVSAAAIAPAAGLRRGWQRRAAVRLPPGAAVVPGRRRRHGARAPRACARRRAGARGALAPVERGAAWCIRAALPAIACIPCHRSISTG